MLLRPDMIGLQLQHILPDVQCFLVLFPPGQCMRQLLTESDFLRPFPDRFTQRFCRLGIAAHSIIYGTEIAAAVQMRLPLIFKHQQVLQRQTILVGGIEFFCQLPDGPRRP